MFFFVWDKMNNYEGLRINQKTVAIPLRTKELPCQNLYQKMLQNEDQYSRQISRLRSRPKPRPLHLQSCSIHNNNKLSSIFQSQIHFKTLHPLACGSKTPHPLVLYSTTSLFIYQTKYVFNLWTLFPSECFCCELGLIYPTLWDFLKISQFTDHVT